MMPAITQILLSSFERAPWGWGLFGLVALAIIKGWPSISDAAVRAREAVNAGKRSTIDDLRERIVALESKVEAATTAAHTAEMRLVHAVSAVQLVAGLIPVTDRDQPAFRRAMDLLSAATMGGMAGWGSQLAEGLAHIKGTGE